MMVLMNADAVTDQSEEVLKRIAAHNLHAVRLPGDEHVAIGITSAIPANLREILTEELTSMPGVVRVVQISRPYKLASREFHSGRSIILVVS